MFGSGSTATISLVGNGGRSELIFVHDVVAAFTQVLVAVDTEDVDAVGRVRVTWRLRFAQTGWRVREIVLSI